MNIRIGLIGTGVMGTDHAKIMSQLSGADLLVVCDPVEAKAKEVAEVYAVPEVSTNPEDVIARDDIDAIIVASPDHTHASFALTCIAAGKPVLLEKPLAQDIQSSKQVIEAEMSSGRPWVQIGFMRRYDRSYLEMKQALLNGTLGRALIMHNFHRNVETPASDFTGAMAITNSASHEFDIVRFVLDTEFKSVTALQPTRSDDLVAPVVMLFETTTGQIVNIEINNNASYGYDVRAELVGEKAGIATNHIAYTQIDRALGNAVSYAADWRDRYAEAYTRQNRAFLEFARTGGFPINGASSWDGYVATCVAQSGVEALNSGEKVTLALPKKPVFYCS